MSGRSSPVDASPFAPTGEGLGLEGLVVAYGGQLAVDHLDLSAPMGAITGLIGPNGAGKTTTFNAASGLVRPKAGTVRLFGTDVTGAKPGHRARMGLGRTFQRMQLVDSLSVRTNVALGSECRIVGIHPLRQLVTRPAERRQVAADTDGALERCGLGPLADRPVGTLSTGQRRRVELARVLAGGFRFLLLDEPSSGLDEEETIAFGQILQEVVHDRGLGMLLVEHDVSLVMAVCSHVHVLDFGRPLFDGPPAEVQASPEVRAAYLGSQVGEAS